MIRMPDNSVEASKAAQRLHEQGHQVEFPSPYAPMAKTREEHRRSKADGGAR